MDTDRIWSLSGFYDLTWKGADLQMANPIYEFNAVIWKQNLSDENC